MLMFDAPFSVEDAVLLPNLPVGNVNTAGSEGDAGRDAPPPSQRHVRRARPDIEPRIGAAGRNARTGQWAGADRAGSAEAAEHGRSVIPPFILPPLCSGLSSERTECVDLIRSMIWSSMVRMA